MRSTLPLALVALAVAGAACLSTADRGGAIGGGTGGGGAAGEGAGDDAGGGAGTGAGAGSEGSGDAGVPDRPSGGPGPVPGEGTGGGSAGGSGSGGMGPPPDAAPPDEVACDTVCATAWRVCEPAGDLCSRDCERWDLGVRKCLLGAGECRSAFSCVPGAGGADGPGGVPGDGPPRPQPDPTDLCEPVCADVGARCPGDVAAACKERCAAPAGPGFPAACVDAAMGCDEVGACFGTAPDVCAEVCPVAEAACPGLLGDCMEACAALPEQGVLCVGEAEDCADVLSCVFDQVSDCEDACGRIADLCGDDVRRCLERCDEGHLDVEDRICAENADSCFSYERCLEFVDADCIGACVNVERICPAEDDACNFDCGVWDEATVACVGTAASCGEYRACTEGEEGRDGPAPPELPGGGDADAVCIGVCAGLIPAAACPGENAVCEQGCRAIQAADWACVAAAAGDCAAIDACIAGPAAAGAEHARLCDRACDQVRQSCPGPLGLFCEDTCMALRPAEPAGAEAVECLADVTDDGGGLDPRECREVARCLDLEFLFGGPGGGGGPR